MAKKRRTVPPPSPPQPVPASKDAEFELRLIRVADKYQAIRVNVRTGDSWTIAIDKLIPVAETGALPAGDYEVFLLTDDTNWTAFRIDRSSGVTWQLRGQSWIKVKEPDGGNGKP